MIENPLNIMQEWLKKEESLNRANPNRVVLSTCSKEAIPHSRVVAIRKITSQGLLFFTQLKTQKVHELKENNKASITLWLASQQAQITLDGYVTFLNEEENLKYWNENSRTQQLRFSAYAPTSGKSIKSTVELDEKLKILENEFVDMEIPMSSYYCGIHFIALTISTYKLKADQFSDYNQYNLIGNQWQKRILSP